MKITIFPTKTSTIKPIKLNKFNIEICSNEVVKSITEIMQAKFNAFDDTYAFIEEPTRKTLSDAVRLACQPAASGISLHDLWIRLATYESKAYKQNHGVVLNYFDAPNQAQGFMLCKSIESQLLAAKRPCQIANLDSVHLRRLADYGIVGIDIFLGNIRSKDDSDWCIKYANKLAQLLVDGVMQWQIERSNKNGYSSTLCRLLADTDLHLKNTFETCQGIMSKLSAGQAHHLNVLQTSLRQTQRALLGHE